ncbi:MAG TPA: hypothetical protein VGM76_01635 [Lacipirellulaceae bacterium]
MLRHLSSPAMLVAGAILSAVGCQACSSCYDYSRPVADCQCNCCGCERCGSAHCGCNSCGCTTGDCAMQDGDASGATMMEEGPASQGSVQQGPVPQSMPQGSRTMNQGPASAQ